MPAGAESGLAANLVWVLGWTGVAIFYARFYIQWIASELKKRVVIPVAFWYMSVVGSVFQFIFGACIRSPMGTLGQTFNLAVYARNLVHIWREKGALSRRKAIAINTAAAAIVLLMLSVTVRTWYAEYVHNQTLDTSQQAREAWFWIAVGLVGQVLFACRFLIQWIATEMKKKSVVPTAFWYVSIIAAFLLMVSYIKRHEWPYVVGLASTIPVYARNLWFIYMKTAPSEAGEEAS